MTRIPIVALCCTALLLVGSITATAQIMEGDLRVTVRDPAGAAVAARIELTGRSPEFHAAARADAEGRAQLGRLPLGVYRLVVNHDGFETHSESVEIRSAVPQTREVTLKIGVIATELTVRTDAPLLDPLQPSLVMQRARKQLEEASAASLGRSTIDAITTLPGWLLEANAVLHPRGSEYDTQYVMDGMPLYDNRSIAFAPAFENGELEAVNVMTAGIPAEYGRRLGGVIALDTRRAGQPGHSTEASLLGGSFGTYSGSLGHQVRAGRTTLLAGAQAGRTDRYLDPPSLENFTNRATAGGMRGRLDRDLGDRDHLTFYLRSNRTGFLAPNDLVQQEAGQRQDRSAAETAGQVHYQHTFSSNTLGSVRGMVRDLTSRLWSNVFSTPVWVDQDQGFRESALAASLAVDRGHHTLKLGGDVRSSALRETFRFAEADEWPELDLDFRDRRRSTETSVFLQDHLRAGNFSAALGIRFDHYRLLIRDSAISPRLGLSYYVPSLDLLLRASYDRVFQPPPEANLLLSSAAAGLDLGDVGGAVPVPASRANFFEVGIRKPFWNRFRLDISHYWRTFRNYVDDDVFLNTGLSFPITFDTARIQGTEIRLELPDWRGISAFASYSNMLGKAASPVTGGLFLHGGEAEGLRDEVERFPISQDQRNTLAAQIRVEPHRRLWWTAGVRYGSGLPVELEDEDAEEEDEDHDSGISEAILDRVDFERGRVRPNFSLDFSAGIRVLAGENRALTLQVDARNVTDRLNVINFTGLFSGTALAPGRQMSLQLRTMF